MIMKNWPHPLPGIHTSSTYLSIRKNVKLHRQPPSQNWGKMVFFTGLCDVPVQVLLVFNAAVWLHSPVHRRDDEARPLWCYHSTIQFQGELWTLLAHTMTYVGVVKGGSTPCRRQYITKDTSAATVVKQSGGSQERNYLFPLCTIN